MPEPRVWDRPLPARPRLVDDVLPVPFDGGVYLLGGPGRTLHGRGLDRLLARLRPALDGTRTIAEAAAALRMPADALAGLVDSLHEVGLIAAADPPEDDLARAFDRLLTVSGQQPSGQAARRALAGARVTVAGNRRDEAALAALLTEMGVRTATPAIHADLAVVVGDAMTISASAGILRDLRCPLLAVDTEGLTIGPLTEWGVSACPVCAREQLPPAPTGKRNALLVRAVLARAALQVVADQTGLWPAPALEQVERLAPDGTATTFGVLRLPGCRLCGRADAPRTSILADRAFDSLALAYHRNVFYQPWQLRQPLGVQRLLAAPLHRFTPSPFHEHPAADRVALPAVPDLPPPGPLDLDRLAALLRWSAGAEAEAIEGGYDLRRATASAGNLGSAELYLFVRDVPGLAPGRYHYRVPDGALEVLATGPVDADLAALGRPPDRAWLADAAVVALVVSAVDRAAVEYLELGYLHTLLDAGLLAGRIETLAGALGLTARVEDRFDDRVAADLTWSDGLADVPAVLVALGSRS